MYFHLLIWSCEVTLHIRYLAAGIFPFTLADVTDTNIFREQLYMETLLQIPFEVNTPI